MKIGHISIYPYPKNLSSPPSQGGVASYLKYLLTSMKEVDENIELIVLANIFQKSEEYFEDNIKIIRCWKKNITYIFTLYYQILKNKIEVVHLQQELGLYGGYLNAYLFPVFLLVLKLSDITVLSNIHGVVDLTNVNNNFTSENNLKIPPILVKIGLKILISPIVWFSDKVIVHEKKFKNDLITHYWRINPEKIFVIPHGVVDFKKIDKGLAKKNIGHHSEKKICLFVGYLTGYKGLELLIDSFSLLNERNDIFLYIAAGEHPKLKNNSAYLKNVYNFHKNKAERKIKTENYKWVGFISEDDLVNYYSAADFTIFPYTVSMSSSGPMAISIGYEVPFIASDVFQHFVNNRKLLFQRDKKSLKFKIIDVIENYEDYTEYSSRLKNQLNWKKISKKYINLYKTL